MRCVRCGEPITTYREPCPRCRFQGDPALVEELGHIIWLFGQIDTLNRAGVRTLPLLEHYVKRRRELENQLGLLLPPLSRDRVQQMAASLAHEETLLHLIDRWLAAGWLDPDKVSPVIDQTRHQVRDLQGQLSSYTTPPYPQTKADRLKIVEFLAIACRGLAEQGAFVSDDAAERVKAWLEAERSSLEQLPAPPQLAPPQLLPAQPPPSAKPPAIPPTLAPPPAAITPAAPQAPRPPLRERFWRTLLSERTLQAMLFLGIFLLFSAALSFVFWGWKDFPALLRVAIPALFTLAFLALGWYVRSQTRMYRSGIALTAIAALLIPIDFYTLYINFNIPLGYTPAFELITSLACLAAYLAIARLTQSGLFGLLAGTAAGGGVLSLVELGHQHLALSRDWNAAALSILAVALVWIATALGRADNAGQWRVLAEPFRNLALVATGAIMLLSFGWRYIDRHVLDTLHNSMTLSWWLGGLLFGWGAIHYRSRTLGILAAITLPVATFVAQAALFDQAHISAAWHAFGLALLVPIYLTVGHRLLAHQEDRVLHGHGRTATGWGIALAVVSAVWSLTNLTGSAAAASTHAVLWGSVLLALFLWQQPRILYAASLFAITTVAFFMTELNLAPNQFSVGWASLAIAYLVTAANGTRGLDRLKPEFREGLVKALVDAGLVIAALALVPTFLSYNGTILAYALGNWLVLSAWSARLSHLGQAGYAPRGRWDRAWFHWLTALPLPAWVWVVAANRGLLDSALPLALSALAWGMVALSYPLAAIPDPVASTPPRTAGERLIRWVRMYRWPWYTTGLLVSVMAPVVALGVARDGFAPAICLLAAGALYIADAVASRQRWELVPGALVTAWGWAWLLDRSRVSFDAVTFATAALVAVYIVAGLWMERRRSPNFNRRFWGPLYLASHVISGILLSRMANAPLAEWIYHSPWTTEIRLWQAAACILLGSVYAAYAWGHYQERWGHVAVWLFAAGGGFLAISFSTGSGSLAARAALGAIVYVLVERGLLGWWRNRLHPPASLNGTRPRTGVRLVWRLYHRPLLIAGWAVSIGVIGIALIRNMILLGGGRTQQLWAAVAIAMVVALYALSARLFRRARFVWFAAFLAFLPWTIMTNLGWLTAQRPHTMAFAISWTILAWLSYLVYLIALRFAPAAYALPLRVFAHLLLPWSLLWGIADADTSRITFGLAIALYALEALRAIRQLRRPDVSFSRLRLAFLYPALGLVPVWCVYLLNLVPGARHEHYGLMLSLFGVFGLAAGQWLRRAAPRQEAKEGMSAPAYLTGYVATITGTLLVAHDSRLLALVLTYDALLMLASARLFKNPLWAFSAAALAPLAFWLALNSSGIPGNRHGWWLTGLAADYLLLAWALRRARLAPYATAPLAMAFALIAFALPPSSQDNVGALWGYLGAAVLYAVTAFWLRQPLLLTPASALLVVAYAAGLRISALAPENYGLALFPAALAALAAASLLDARLGARRDFPWGDTARWGIELAKRVLEWWALPLYAAGFVLAAVSPLYTHSRDGLAALNCLLSVPLFAWAIYRFRLRAWLFATAVAGQLAVVFYLADLGWWRYPSEAWVRFVPVTLVTAGAALVIALRRKEEPPLQRRVMPGWSYPLYLLVLLDLIPAQASSFAGTQAGAVISLAHALLVAVLASFWLSRFMPVVSALLGIIALAQWMVTQTGPLTSAPAPFALLALAYGLVGYGLAFLRGRRGFPAWVAIWEQPLQWFGLVLSYVVLAATAMLGINLVQWSVRALFGLPFRQIVDMATAQMVVGVLGLSGLLYLAAAFVHRRLRVSYLAVAMLLVAWMIHAFYVQQWDVATKLQLYALPAGLYLLGVAFLEYERGNKNLARWIDYAAVVLMMGSLFWQTLLYGWGYAVLLGTEGFAAFWWGSARRLRRFLYAGMMGVVLATLAQLINSLQSINQWLVFGIIGLTIVVSAILIERRMEDVKALRQTLDTWE